MFNSKQTYINNSSVATPVVYKSQEVSAEFKGKGFIAAAVMAVSFGVLSIQAGYVINANANGNPISSPITAQPSPIIIQCPAGKVAKVVDSTIICVSQNENPNQTQNQNQTNASGGSSSSSSSSVNLSPISAPEVSPSPSASASSAPVTSPEVNNPQPSVTSNSGGNPSNGGGSSSNNSGGSSSAPSCETQAPKAPVIVSAVTTGKNEITLNWSKPLGNVTHYSVSYGVMKNKPLYGVANVGNVTSFTVRGLSGGTTFYFTVKAVNDCTPSVASNEVAIKVGGKFINSPAQGFKPGVLGKSVKNTNTSSSASLKPAATPAPAASVAPISTPKQSNGGLLGKVTSFFSNIF